MCDVVEESHDGERAWTCSVGDASVCYIIIRLSLQACGFRMHACTTTSCVDFAV
jgi:hypothetical protein